MQARLHRADGRAELRRRKIALLLERLGRLDDRDVLGLLARLRRRLRLLGVGDLLVGDREELVVVGLQLVRRLELAEVLTALLDGGDQLRVERGVVRDLAVQLGPDRVGLRVHLRADLVGLLAEVAVAERLVVVAATTGHAQGRRDGHHLQSVLDHRSPWKFGLASFGSATAAPSRPPTASAQTAPAPARCQGQSTRLASRNAAAAQPSSRPASVDRARQIRIAVAAYRASAKSSPAIPSSAASSSGRSWANRIVSPPWWRALPARNASAPEPASGRSANVSTAACHVASRPCRNPPGAPAPRPAAAPKARLPASTATIAIPA